MPPGLSPYVLRALVCDTLRMCVVISRASVIMESWVMDNRDRSTPRLIGGIYGQSTPAGASHCKEFPLSTSVVSTISCI
jgi:hypothetical protein